MQEEDATKENRRMEHVRSAAQGSLNMEGYPLQYMVLQSALDRSADGSSQWVLERTEFPVEVRGKGTRIDFVLRRPGNMHMSALFMLAECKRVNSATSYWCFFTAPKTSFRAKTGYVSLDVIKRDHNNELVVSRSEQYVQGGATHYHVAIEVKPRGVEREEGTEGSNNQQQSKSRGVIEDACSQIMCGLNGMIELAISHGLLLFGPTYLLATFIPVIFTTASLWVSDVDLSTGNIKTGNVDLSRSNFHEVSWLLYQYNLSPGLKHERTLDGAGRWPNTFSDIVEFEFERTIAIVNVNGIAEFMSWSNRLRDQ